jgi:hypothetical protein
MRKIHTIWYVIIPCDVVSYQNMSFHTYSCHFTSLGYLLTNQKRDLIKVVQTTFEVAVS